MRITNKIIQNNSLTNINTNRVLQDKLSTQISTGKKISRPSDDPIVALRSLRLRTSANQTGQYLDKNVEDAKSWLAVTEDAISTLSDIITDIRSQFVKGNVDSLTVSDRDVIRENLQALQQELYNTGNADFAGRSVFTGYRTDSPLTFQQNEQINYTITENFIMKEDIEKTDATVADSISYVHDGKTGNEFSDEQQVYQADITRLRLSYNSCNEGDLTISLSSGDTVTATSMKLTDSPDPYETVYNDPDAVVYVAQTGEILLGENVSEEWSKNYLSIEVSYSKNDWNKGDLRPEHYFKCTDNTNSIVYNESGATGEIEYNVGVNQAIRVNTLANECFTHDVSRDIDDLITAIDEVEEIEAEIADLKSKLAAVPESDTTQKEEIQKKLDAALKVQTYANEKLHNAFSSGIGKADKYLDRNNLALTNTGTRSKRLELIENRLSTQSTTIDELKSENEDADLAETAIKLSSAEYAYNAALMATGKIMKESLLNYI